MIAEEYKDGQTPDSSIPKGSSIEYILGIIKSVPVYFISALNKLNIKKIKTLNENDLTQILVEQINFALKDNPTVNAQNQYSDLFYRTKGIPDFYFHTLEQGKTNIPLFVVEAKRLPAPSHNREKEYVIGEKQNGGIERFKLEKHGKGMEEAGIVGYIEENDPDYWYNKINNWISELAKQDNFWDEDEQLQNIEKTNCSYLISIAHKKSNIDIELHHIWIEI